MCKSFYMLENECAIVSFCKWRKWSLSRLAFEKSEWTARAREFTTPRRVPQANRCASAQLEPTPRIFHRATEWASRRDLYGLTRQGLPQCKADVVRVARNILEVFRRTTVNRSVVDHHALLVDDDHLWPGSD